MKKVNFMKAKETKAHPKIWDLQFNRNGQLEPIFKCVPAGEEQNLHNANSKTAKHMIVNDKFILFA